MNGLSLCGIVKILWIIPLRAGIGVKFNSQFIPNFTGQQCNLEKLYSFSQIPLGGFETVHILNPLLVYFPNPPRAIWDRVFSKSSLTSIDGDSAEDSDTTTTSKIAMEVSSDK